MLKWFLVTVIMGSNISFLQIADVCQKIFYAVPPTPQPLFLTFATNRKVTNCYLFGKCLSASGAVIAVSLACPAIECLLLPSVCDVQITFVVVVVVWKLKKKVVCIYVLLPLLLSPLEKNFRRTIMSHCPVQTYQFSLNGKQYLQM